VRRKEAERCECFLAVLMRLGVTRLDALSSSRGGWSYYGELLTMVLPVSPHDLDTIVLTFRPHHPYHRLPATRDQWRADLEAAVERPG
jgi:hypothetical protein